MLLTSSRVRTAAAFAGICLLGLFAACQSKQEKVEAERGDLQEERAEVAEEQRDVAEAVQELNEAQRQARVEWQQEYLSFKREMVGEISQNEQLILEKRSEIANLDATAQETYNAAVKEAEHLNNELRDKLNNATDQGDEAWQSFKDGFRTSVNQVEESIKNIHIG